MKAIFLVGAVQAFFLAILLVSKKNKITADYILSVWLIITAIPLFLYFINYESYSYILNNSKSIPTYLMIINIPFLLVQSPFLFIYVNTIIKGTKNFKLSYLLHFIPVLLFFLSFYIVIGFRAEDKMTFNLFDYKYHQLIISFFPFTLILAFFYIIKSYLKIEKYKKTLYKQFSYTENIDFNWLKNLILITSSVWIVLGIFAFMFKKIHTEVNIHDIVLISASIAIFIIGYFGFLKTNVFFNKELLIKKNSIEKKKNVIPDENIEKLIKKVKAFMLEEKPYLESKLSIKQLADMLSIQTYQLSGIINDYLHKNFFDFVNEYRVEEVKKQMQKNKNYTLLAIAYDCGFNSKSSFNRIFKNLSGLTPSEYQKKNKLQ
ncbi:MAG: helix-turn-helix domain-containing protein [Bacteroidales bacterium]|nr:helix-turn-helix domain-containing protein [Bacteroidales bacterium]